ncbi:MAG: TonB-dependent receptor [Deltaproteobacteria bacterium]|nr:TonB-dependent receptor [Deltaproteobacteria bacterium]
MKLKSVTVCIAIIILVFPFMAYPADEAEQQDYNVYKLGEIVVSEEEPAVEDVAITNEISAEEIEATNSRTVAEALQYVPGVHVTTGRKAEPNISIQGFNQDKAVILIDGVPYYETKYGKLDLNQIPTDIVAKIVVTKGAASVLYGANAEAGVINIITKAPSEKPFASVNVEFGEKNYNRESISHGRKVGIFNYWLNYSHKETDGWKMANGYDPVEGWHGHPRRTNQRTYMVMEDGGFRDNSDSKSDAFWLKFGVEPKKGSEYAVNFHNIQSEKGFPPSIYENKHFTSTPAFSQLARSTNYDDWGVDVSGRQKITTQLNLKAKLFYHNHTDDYVSYTDPTYTTAMACSSYKDYLVGGSLFADYKFAGIDTVRVAFNYKVDSHKQRDDTYLPFEESKSKTGSIGVENEFTMIDNLSIVAGISYDWFDVTKAQTTDSSDTIEELDTPDRKDEVNPMLGAAYTFADSTKLFGSVAKKTRFPTLNELYSSNSGNQNLQAEESINYTLGTSRTFVDMLRTDLSFFHHDISDRISRPDSTSLYENCDKVEMSGVEFNSALFPLDKLMLKVGYTYNYAKNKSSNRMTDRIEGVPEHKVDLGARYKIPYVETTINFTGTYMAKIYSQLPTASSPTLEEREVNGYWLFGARVTQPITQYGEIYIAANNIFDRNYEQEWGFPGQGRNVFCGITIKY